jgi:hypothetical protein
MGLSDPRIGSGDTLAGFRLRYLPAASGRLAVRRRHNDEPQVAQLCDYLPCRPRVSAVGPFGDRSVQRGFGWFASSRSIAD